MDGPVVICFQTVDKYAYSGNDPVNLSDPGGNNPVSIGMMAFGAIGGLIGQAYNDYNNGSLSSLSTYGSAAAKGAITGAVGGIVGKTVGKTIGSVVGKAVEGLTGSPAATTTTSGAVEGIVGGAASGAVGDLMDQRSEDPTGEIDMDSIATAAETGAGVGGLFGTVSPGENISSRIGGVSRSGDRVLSDFIDTFLGFLTGKVADAVVDPTSDDEEATGEESNVGF